MRIGIGVTSFNRPKHLKLFMAQLKKHYMNKLDPPLFCVTAYDKDDDRRGIAYRKNECLRELVKHECDFYFLLDDDVLIIKDGALEFFIEAHKASGQHHFLYLLQTPQTKKIADHIKSDDPLVPSPPYHIEQYDNSNGCFMFLTKEVIEKVGAFDETFFYGWEHSQYTKRVYMAGLTNMGECLSVAGSDEYLYAMDLQSDREFNKIVQHKSSLKPKEALEHIAKGQEHYNKVITEIYIPL